MAGHSLPGQSVLSIPEGWVDIWAQLFKTNDVVC